MLMHLDGDHLCGGWGSCRGGGRTAASPSTKHCWGCSTKHDRPWNAHFGQLGQTSHLDFIPGTRYTQLLCQARCGEEMRCDVPGMRCTHYSTVTVQHRGAILEGCEIVPKLKLATRYPYLWTSPLVIEIQSSPFRYTSYSKPRTGTVSIPG